LKDAIEKADVLIEALRWIRKFRGKITVIKLGGSVLEELGASVMEEPRAMTHLLLDVLFMESVDMRPVIVHGGGAAISRAMNAAGLQPQFVQGRRYTDDATLKIVEEILAYQTSEGISRQIRDLGGEAQSLNFHTVNVLFGERLKLTGPDGQSLDLGHVGTVTRVDGDTIRGLFRQNVIPVIPSMCMGKDGQKYNVNADTAATAVAQELRAEKLVYLSDVNGVRRSKDDPDSLIDSLTAEEARKLIADGTIASGMIPKVQACLDTLDQGIGKVHIIDGRLRHSLLLEVFTSKGVGTEIVREARPA
jgi:acetylglutamate kinase